MAGSGGTGGSGVTAGSGGTGALGGSGGSGGKSGAGGADAGGGNGLHGAFLVALKNEPPPEFTDLIGRIYNGPQPPSMGLKLDSEESGCQLLVPKVSFCSPMCMGGVCVDENTCMIHPTLVGVGIAHVTGFKGGDLMLTGDTKIYTPIPTLPANACDEGVAIEVHTDKFTLQGKCIAPLVLTAGVTDKIQVKTGMPVKVLWKAPGQMNISRIEIHLDIAHHGGKTGEINCDVPDTGSFDIPATLTTKLISLGLAGFPTINVRRVHTAYAASEPKVRLQIGADLERDVDTGVVSCGDTPDCPPGQMCDANHKICK